ncbi:MAG: UDP-galactopyranose mutase [Holophagales bacterium]|jgi:UDP-galactopyranose mutase|nr:UDP-galactopyranose mutase [Holophagales bacterium]
MRVAEYDLVVAGCGFVGSVVAHLAAQNNKRVLLLERRSHIAGNMYDEVDLNTGILVQKYGPHSFHTIDDRVYDFLTSVGDWYPFTLTARVEMLGRATPSPFNFTTIETYFEPQKAHALKKRLMDTYRYAPKVTIVELLKSDDPLIREYADFLFENDYRPYTVKQWNIRPEELDISVLSRVPVRNDYIDRYFDDKYQMMPEGGFTAFFKKLLGSPLIEVRLNCDALEHLKIDTENGRVMFDGEELRVPVVYTGALDELFERRFGKLPYRSVWFEFKTLNMDSFQDAPGVAHPLAKGYTRITEYTKLPPQDGRGKTIVAYEYPAEYGGAKGKEPYYPVLTAESMDMRERYGELAKSVKNLHLGGRLADFKYYNMDQAVLRALEIYDAMRQTTL